MRTLAIGVLLVFLFFFNRAQASHTAELQPSAH